MMYWNVFVMNTRLCFSPSIGQMSMGSDVPHRTARFVPRGVLCGANAYSRFGFV